MSWPNTISYLYCNIYPHLATILQATTLTTSMLLFLGGVFLKTQIMTMFPLSPFLMTPCCLTLPNFESVTLSWFGSAGLEGKKRTSKDWSLWRHSLEITDIKSTIMHIKRKPRSPFQILGLTSLMKAQVKVPTPTVPLLQNPPQRWIPSKLCPLTWSTTNFWTF